MCATERLAGAIPQGLFTNCVTPGWLWPWRHGSFVLSMARKTTTDALSLFDTLVYTCEYRLVMDPASAVLAHRIAGR